MTKKKKIKRRNGTLGIDASLNGTAITYFENNELKDYIFFTTKKKTVNESDHAILIPNFNNMTPRLIWLVDKVTEIIKYFSPEYIALEDYSFGSKGMNFHIGGFIEGFKMNIYKEKIPLRTYEPTKIKQFATGSGSAGKDIVAVEAIKKWNIDFTQYGDDANNIVDAFIINKLLNLELQIRSNPELLKTLPKYQQHVFTHTTKANPTPLINRQFILKED